MQAGLGGLLPALMSWHALSCRTGAGAAGCGWQPLADQPAGWQPFPAASDPKPKRAQLCGRLSAIMLFTLPWHPQCNPPGIWHGF